MKYKIRNIIQIVATVTVIISCSIYYMYINEIIDFRFFSIGDMNPYGGWSAVKSAFTDLSYRWRGFSRSIALTFGITITALLLGRFFCGFICPIGAMQDFFKYLGSKIKLKEIKFSHKPEFIKYIILIIILTVSILGMGNIISPISPWIAYLNIFAGFNLQPGIVILLLIALISLFGRRIFCRYFCFLGAFQSLLYAIGPFKIKKNNCESCSYCLRNCPVSEHLRISEVEENISPECINCLECINTCVKDNEGYSIKIGNKKIKSNIYIIICICLILSSYILLPLIDGTDVQAIATIENVKDGIYLGSGIGFGGIMNVEVIINNNKISNIKILNHRETTGYYEEVFRHISYKIMETQNLNLDAVSGATSSSRGFINSVKDAVSKSLVN